MSYYLFSVPIVNYGWSDFQNLTCLSLAHELKNKSVDLIKEFSGKERFCLSNQKNNISDEKLKAFHNAMNKTILPMIILNTQKLD
jgi:hypothetical protein